MPRLVSVLCAALLLRLCAENARSGAIWRWFMANPEVGRALAAAGFSP